MLSALLDFRGLWDSRDPAVADIGKIERKVRRLPKGTVLRLGGIDAFNSGLIYRNITGAVEEAFAEPEKFFQPRYFEGRNYSPTLNTDIGEIYMQMDQGGVHANSGVTNYLAYCISPANSGIMGTALGYDEILKLL